MAETPEVEILVRDIRARLTGRVICAAEVYLPETVRFTTPEAFARAIAGARIAGASRRAKWTLIALDGARTLAIHYMLFGYLRLEPEDAPREARAVLALRLDSRDELRLLDRLGYARVALLPDDELAARLGLDTLGPEILADDFTAATLAERFARKRTPVKPALLDQHIVAGMGNRDADESLWLARIDPRRPAGSLTQVELARLTDAMRTVLHEGISRGGTMTDLVGNQGSQWEHVNIFERAGKPCPRCGAPVQKMRQQQRNTFACLECQR